MSYRSLHSSKKGPSNVQPSVIDLTTEEEEAEVPSQMEAHLESDDYFEVLNLPRSASGPDVKRAYRKLAVQWHPDKNRSNARAEEIFKKISGAYEVLSDPEKRKAYAMYGKAGLRGHASAGEGEDFWPQGHEGFSTQHARDIFNAFFGGNDPFQAFFGSPRQQNGLFEANTFGSMGFGGRMGGMGFGNMGMPGMNSFFSDGFHSMNGPGTMYSSGTSSSSSTFRDRSGHTITQKTTTITKADGRTETVTEEYRNGELVYSSSGNRQLADAGRMQLEGTGQSTNGYMYQRQRF
ncbi:uncharacterized protein CCR75_005998 [Bremia lactucae]|uniref:J domain-containing protein n=1 Tax=Bremia lactucae TaxID=4779 RepID=A0A976FQN8_BRELC|nr:hypothetical protein CCR75_005998 [Bremia lactucae]